MSEITAVPPPRWAVVSWAVLIFGLIGGLLFVTRHSEQREIGRSTLIAEVRSQAMSKVLRDCLAQQGARSLALGGKPGIWRVVDGEYEIWESGNGARNLRVQIEERGLERIVRFYTRDGRPLRAPERKVLDACVALPPF